MIRECYFINVITQKQCTFNVIIQDENVIVRKVYLRNQRKNIFIVDIFF